MNKYFIAEGRNTPLISFDPDDGKFEISGKSYPENTERFFRGPLLWLNTYVEGGKPRDIELHLKFEFISSSSVICVLQVLKEIDRLREKGFNIKVMWFVMDDDDDIRITGEDLESLCEQLTFEYVVV